MEKIRVRVRVEGLVQGVFYRYSTQRRAQELGVNGWVRNLWDGNVECLLEGERGKVEALLQWCHQGPPGAQVKKVTTHCEEYKGDLRGFSIQY
ncbi:MAG: acylphosphatase [Deltaproteobacteria bacterium]|nr:acylphosphatase [Deltaproteobacteria bacterium]